jgi:uncharacterized protein YciI
MKNWILIILFALLGRDLSGQEHLFFVFLHTNPDREKLEANEAFEIQAAHLNNIDSLYRIGELLAAGPFEGGGGIFVLLADSLEEARRMVQTDPAILAKRFITEIVPLILTKGTICDGEDKKVDETLMSIFPFLLFKPNQQLTPQEKENLLQSFDGFSTGTRLSNDILVAGDFGASGGFVILRRDDPELIMQMIEEHPYTQIGMYGCVQKRIWLNQGTFCE